MFKLFKKKFEDESLEEQKTDIERYPSEIKSLILGGLSCDQIQNATGEFGKTTTNPIPVNGILGEIKYLNRLRTITGDGLIFHRLGSFDKIDIFEVVSVSGRNWDVLFFDMYHPRRSTALPKGYSFSEFNEIFSRNAIGFGINTFDKDFPFSIPKLMESKYGTLGKSLGSKLELMLKNNKFERNPKEHRLKVLTILYRCIPRNELDTDLIKSLLSDS